jgi:hypothetical protein
MSLSTGYYKQLYVNGQAVQPTPSIGPTEVEQCILTAGYEGESFIVSDSSFNWQQVGGWVQFSGFVEYTALPSTPGSVYLPLPNELSLYTSVPDNEIALASLTSALPNLGLRADGINNDGFILTSNGVEVNSSSMPTDDTLRFSGKFRMF